MTRTTSPSDSHYSDPDAMYHSDPGVNKKKRSKKLSSQDRKMSLENDYYSEPDTKYFEIDYEFLKQLSMLADMNVKYKRKLRKAKQKKFEDEYAHYEKLVDTSEKTFKRNDNRGNMCPSKTPYKQEVHCSFCCLICKVSGQKRTSKVCKCQGALSMQLIQQANGSRSTEKYATPVRRGSVHSTKSVSFIDEKDPQKSPNYIAKSFTNDLKQFLLRPSPSRFSLKEKLLTSFRSNDEKEKDRSRKDRPSIGAIKGFWKSL